MYTRPVEPDARVDPAPLRAKPAGARRQHGRLQGRPRLRRDRRAVRPPLRGASRRRCRPAPTPTSPATPRWRGASSPPASCRACRCSSARTRSRRRPTSSTSCPSTRTSACARCRPRTRSPASAPRSAPPSAGTSASPPPAARAWRSRPRPWAWRSASSCRCSIIDIQRGGPSTGLPTKTEAADLLHGDVRPPRRGAAADRRRPQPGALLRGGHRGGPHRPQVPHAGDPAVRRLPGQRLRAVAAARRRRRCPTSRSTFATEPNHTDGDGEPVFWPYLRDPETLARPWALPGTPGPDAPHRRHREGGRVRQHLLRPRQPRAHGAPAGRRRSPASPATSRRSRCTATSTTPSCSSLGWGSTWGAIDGAVDRLPAPRARKVAHAHLMHLNPFPPNLGEVLRRYPRVLVPEMNLGQLVAAGPGRVPGRRPVGHQGAGRAVHRRRARAGDPRSAGGR